MQLPFPLRSGQKKPWTSIPRINWAHPLAKGLVFYGYDTGGGLVVDLVDGLQPTIITAPISNGASAQGAGLRYTSGGGALVFANSGNIVKIFPASRYSIAAAWNITTLPSIANTCLFGVNDSAGNNAVALLWDSAATNDIEIIVANTNAGVFSGNSVGTFHSLVTTNTTATAQVTYLDGKSSLTSAVTSAFTATAYQPCFNSFVAGSTPSGNGVAGQIFYGALWNRTITAVEAALLHQDPYCFLIYPEDEIFAELIGVTAATALPNNQYDYNRGVWVRKQILDQSVSLNPNIQTNPFPFNQYEYPKVWNIRRAPFDLSVSLNNNLFLNPIPILNLYNQAKPVNVPQARLEPNQALNINLFTNPYPFNQYDWNKTYRVRQAPIDLSFNQGQLLTNFFPFNQFDYPLAKRVPQARMDPAPGLNINLFTNPFPFNQYDWSKPIKVPQAPIDLSFQQNPNLPNPYPVFNAFQPPAPFGPTKPVDAPYNQNLYTVTVVANPFIPVDFQKPWPLRGAAPVPDGLNPNLFTNPYPVQNYFTPGFGVAHIHAPPQPYNINLYPPPVSAAPFNQTFWPPAVSIPIAPVESNNFVLFDIGIPTNQYDWSKPARPFFTTTIDQTLNLNLYGAAVVTNPIVATDVFVPFAVRHAILPDTGFNPNLFTNPVPFNQYDYPIVRRVPQTPIELSVGLNPNTFTNPIPILNIDYPRVHGLPPVPLDTSLGAQAQLLPPPPISTTVLFRPLMGVGL